MDKIKELLIEEFEFIVSEKEFNRELLAKDYYITILLYLMKDIRGIYFKGGTALQKTILDYARISEDIDFTLERDLSSVKQEIIAVINSSKLFGTITKDKDVSRFTRLIVPYDTKISKGVIFIDLNERGKLLLEPIKLKIKHLYHNISEFKFSCLNIDEMIGEKVAAAIGRNKPRDHYDIYQIIKKNFKINMPIVEEKCNLSGCNPSIIKMFNNAKKLHTRWKTDLEPLLVNPVSFEEVMKTLSEYFKLKDEKDKLKI